LALKKEHPNQLRGYGSNAKNVTVQVATSISRRNYAPGARSAPTDVGGYAIWTVTKVTKNLLHKGRE